MFFFLQITDADAERTVGQCHRTTRELVNESHVMKSANRLV